MTTEQARELVLEVFPTAFVYFPPGQATMLQFDLEATVGLDVRELEGKSAAQVVDMLRTKVVDRVLKLVGG